MTEENKKSLDYITQYANNMSDEQFFDRISNRVAYYELDIGLFIEIADLMPKISDAINQKLFRDVMGTTSDADLQRIIDILTAIDNEDLSELDELLDHRLESMMNENDIQAPCDWFWEADDDLRRNGIYANAVNYATDIDESADFLQLDAYNNFKKYSFIDLVTEFFNEYYF